MAHLLLGVRENSCGVAPAVRSGGDPDAGQPCGGDRVGAGTAVGPGGRSPSSGTCCPALFGLDEDSGSAHNGVMGNAWMSLSATFG